MAIFKNQSLVSIQLDSLTDLTTASSLKILYRKPDYTVGEWTGTLSGTTVVKYDVPDNTVLDQAGTWYIQIKTTIAGKDLFGNLVKMIVSNNLEDPFIAV